MRVAWLCEEMGVPYKTEPVSIFEPSPAFLAANPLRTVPVIRDGDACVIESVAIMLYIMGKYGPTSLALNVISAALSRREIGQPTLASCAALSNAAGSAPGILAVTSR